MAVKSETKKDYLERINKVLVYINENLDEKLDLEKLARLSNFSVYHFHRILRAHLNESLGSYVQRLRLDRAAGLLEHSDETVSDIAYRVGYETPSSFTKAFKKRFGISPNEYREAKSDYRFELEVAQINKTSIMEALKVKIKDIKPKKVIFIQKTGAYGSSETGAAWERVCRFAKEKRLFGMKTEFIGISHDDPHITEEDRLRYDACITVRKEVKPEGEVGFKEIPGGKYAIFRHNGPYEKFQLSYDYIYKKWMPESEYEFGDAPCFEVYFNSPGKTSPEKLKTDIYIPVK